jgi:hypothetical protein
VFTNGKKSFDLTLEPGKSVTFRYRVLILSGKVGPAGIENRYKAFAQQGS